MSVHHIALGSWPFRLDTIDLRSPSALALSTGLEVEERYHTLLSQIDRTGIESGVALRGGKAQDEGDKQESKG